MNEIVKKSRNKVRYCRGGCGVKFRGMCPACRTYLAWLAVFRRLCDKRDSCPADRIAVCEAVYVGGSRAAELLARSRMDSQREEANERRQ